MTSIAAGTKLIITPPSIMVLKNWATHTVSMESIWHRYTVAICNRHSKT